jgi:hypothetical protein
LDAQEPYQPFPNEQTVAKNETCSWSTKMSKSEEETDAHPHDDIFNSMNV